jgi:hypothetical protein
MVGQGDPLPNKTAEEI